MYVDKQALFNYNKNAHFERKKLGILNILLAKCAIIDT